VRSALDDGVLPGGGVALHNESIDLLEAGESQEETVARKILLEAIKAPMRQILENAGLDHKEIVSKIQCTATGREGYDVKNGEHGDMIDMGIIDPTKVTKNALRNAVSVATTLEVMRPVNKYIIIEKIEEELVNKEGLILSKDDEIHYRYKKARVLGVGENVSEISSGDYIYYDQSGGYDMMIDGEKHTIILDRDVVVVLDS
jgi:co-chaperonin GroES (HSP10)